MTDGIGLVPHGRGHAPEGGWWVASLEKRRGSSELVTYRLGQVDNDRSARVGLWAALTYVALLVALDVAFVVMALQVRATEWEGMASYAKSYRGITFVPQAIGLAALPALMVLLAAIHVRTGESRRVWSLTALSFGIAHVVLLGSLYYVQVGILLPALRDGSWGGLDQFAFANPRSVAWGLDHLAWALLGVALLSMVPIFGGDRRRDWIRWLLVLNGVANTSLVLAFAFDIGSMTLVVAFVSWVVALPAVVFLIAFDFRDDIKSHHRTAG